MTRRKRQRQTSLSSPAASRSPSPSPSPTSSSRLSQREALPMDKKSKFDRRFATATTSPEDVLEKQKEKWTSLVYDHYHPPEIVVAGGVVKYVFACKRNPSEKLTRIRHDESTSNLVRHMDHCDPKDSASTRAITAFAHGSTYNPGRFRVKLALWIAQRSRPFAIVEDPELVNLFTDLNHNVVVPSRVTVARDIQEIFQVSRAKVASILQTYAGKLHLCIDGWTSPNVISFLGITVHWVKDNQVQSIILDFVKANNAHTGVYLATRVNECLRSYDIHKKILAITVDNASNNGTLIDELVELLDDFQGSLTHIRCFAHILNLAVKAILSQFSRKTKASKDTDEVAEDDAVFDDLEHVGIDEEADPDMDDLTDDAVDDAEPTTEDSDAVIVDRLAQELEEDEDDEDDDDTDGQQCRRLTREEINLGRFSLSKLTNLGKKIFNSPTLREDLRIQCERNKVKPKLMLRAVATRWNTMAELIGRAIELRDALNTLVTLEQHNRARGVRLQRFKLTKQEWELLVQLFPLLEIFLEATKKLSQSSRPLLHEVIPIFDILTRALDDCVDDVNKFPAVRSAARRGRAMINKYYGLTDDSIMYRIAILLHPRFKASYFVKAKWPRDWIKTAEDIMREQWLSHYKPTTTPTTSTRPVTKKNDNKYFTELDSFQPEFQSADDPITEWLSTPTLPAVTEPIPWWTSMEEAGHPLARMALDFLSAPATSTDVERAFSRGGRTVSKTRHALSDESVRSATILGSWCTLSGAIPSKELATTFNRKTRRPKHQETAESGEKVITIVE